MESINTINIPGQLWWQWQQLQRRFCRCCSAAHLRQRSPAACRRLSWRTHRGGCLKENLKSTKFLERAIQKISKIFAKNRGAQIEGQAPASFSRIFQAFGTEIWWNIEGWDTCIKFPQVEDTNAFFGASKSPSKLENLSSDNHHAFLILSAGRKDRHRGA